MRRFVVSVDTNSIFLFVLLFPCFKPSGIEHFSPALESFLNYWKVGSAIVAILLFVLFRKKINMLETVVFLFSAWVVFMTYIHGNNTYGALIFYLSIFVVVLSIHVFEDNMEALYVSLFWVLFVYISLGFLSVLYYYPEGLYFVYGQSAHYFLGNYNTIVVYFLPAISVSLVYLKFKKSKIPVAILFTEGIVSILIVWSATSIVVLLSFLVFYIIQRKQSLSFKKIFIGFSIINFMITELDFIGRIPVCSWVVAKILRKSTNLTGRIEVWKISKKLISEHFWFGLGRGSHVVYNNSEMYSHNLIYELLLNGGIVALILFIIILIICGKRLDETNSNSYCNRIFFAAFTGIFVGCITEARIDIMTFLLITLAFNIEKINAALTIENRNQ